MQRQTKQGSSQTPSSQEIEMYEKSRAPPKLILEFNGVNISRTIIGDYESTEQFNRFDIYLDQEHEYVLYFSTKYQKIRVPMPATHDMCLHNLSMDFENLQWKYTVDDMPEDVCFKNKHPLFV